MIQYAYSLDLEKIVNIEEVQSGLACNCVSPYDINEVLIARKGDINEHHFAFYNDGTQTMYREYLCNESVQHKSAKQFILDNKEINENVKFKEVLLEKHYIITTKEPLNFVPDIQAITLDDELIFIEIVKTSDIIRDKLVKIRNSNFTLIKILINDDYKYGDKFKDIILVHQHIRNEFLQFAFNRDKETDKLEAELYDYKRKVYDVTENRKYEINRLKTKYEKEIIEYEDKLNRYSLLIQRLDKFKKSAWNYLYGVRNNNYERMTYGKKGMYDFKISTTEVNEMLGIIKEDIAQDDDWF